MLAYLPMSLHYELHLAVKSAGIRFTHDSELLDLWRLRWELFGEGIK